MSEKDVPYKSFYTNSDTYYYMVMSLGLINARITYKGMVNKLFVDVIKNTMEAYTNDMLVKFKIGVDLQRDREQVFARMRIYNMELNPSKWFLTSTREISEVHGKSEEN